VDDDRRRQIEEEERYRAEVRDKLEREKGATPAARAFGGSASGSNSQPSRREPVPPAKPQKRRRGCLGNIGIIILIFVGLAFVGSLLPETESSTAETPNQERTVEPVAAPPLPEETPEPVSEPEPEIETSSPDSTSQVQNEIVTPSGDTIDYFEAKVFCESLVRDQLVAPRSARFPGTFRGNYEEPIKIGNSWVYNVVVDAQNSFGAELRSTFLCTLDGDEDTSSVIQVE